MLKFGKKKTGRIKYCIFQNEKFELIMTGEQLENYTQEERRLLYTDFCLGQRRVELGFCVRKLTDGPVYEPMQPLQLRGLP